MDITILTNAKLTIHNDQVLAGPVTLGEDGVYVFTNTADDLDFSFRLRKEHDQWVYDGDQSADRPVSYAEQIGSQIDSIRREE